MLTCSGSQKLMHRAAEDNFRFVDAELFEHLKCCERCASGLRGLKKLRSALESAPRYAAPAWLAERVMIGIAAEEARGRMESGPLKGLAAALALFFALGAGALSGTFLASNIMDEAGANGARNSSRHALLAYSAGAFDPAPPDRVAGDRLTVVEDANER